MKKRMFALALALGFASGAHAGSLAAVPAPTTFTDTYGNVWNLSQWTVTDPGGKVIASGLSPTGQSLYGTPTGQIHIDTPLGDTSARVVTFSIAIPDLVHPFAMNGINPHTGQADGTVAGTPQNVALFHTFYGCRPDLDRSFASCSGMISDEIDYGSIDSSGGMYRTLAIVDANTMTSYVDPYGFMSDYVGTAAKAVTFSGGGGSVSLPQVATMNLLNTELSVFPTWPWASFY